MLSISSPQQATMLQLQYISESCGLRRTYLESGVPQVLAKPTEVHELMDAKAPQSPESSAAIDTPDIEWHPSYHTFQNRVNRLSAHRDSRPTTLPAEFPDAIHAPRVWTGSDLRKIESFVIQLTGTDILEIENALNYFKGQGVPLRVNAPRALIYLLQAALTGDNGPEEVSEETFPLPSLKQTLREIANTLHNGIGFAVIRGLNPKKYSPLDNLLLYLGITSYIAEIRGCQDYDGRMIGEFTLSLGS
jgi:hypothetical protein